MTQPCAKRSVPDDAFAKTGPNKRAKAEELKKQIQLKLETLNSEYKVNQEKIEMSNKERIFEIDSQYNKQQKQAEYEQKTLIEFSDKVRGECVDVFKQHALQKLNQAEAQKLEIEKHVQGIIDTVKLDPDCSEIQNLKDAIQRKTAMQQSSMSDNYAYTNCLKKYLQYLPSALTEYSFEKWSSSEFKRSKKTIESYKKDDLKTQTKKHAKESKELKRKFVQEKSEVLKNTKKNAKNDI
jgi:hypothetical protein